MTAYGEWCETNHCSHGHCPKGCWHPQPGRYTNDARIVCGKCFHEDGEITEIVPCIPTTCPDHEVTP
jgi:hypothetical protein